MRPSLWTRRVPHAGARALSRRQPPTPTCPAPWLATTQRYRIMPRLFWLSVLPALLTPAVAFAENPPVAHAPGSPGKVSYYKQIRPIFQAQCQGCHQPAKAKGEYVMTAFDRLLAGGESGEKAVVPHHPEASTLVKQITPQD